MSSLFSDNSQTPQQGTQPCMLCPHHPKHTQPISQPLSITCRLCGEACYFIYKLRDQQNGFWVRQHNGECGQNGGNTHYLSEAYCLVIWGMRPFYLENPSLCKLSNSYLSIESQLKTHFFTGRPSETTFVLVIYFYYYFLRMALLPCQAKRGSSGFFYKGVGLIYLWLC